MKEKYLVFSNSEFGEINEFFNDKNEALDFYNEVISKMIDDVNNGEICTDEFICDENENIYLCKVISETEFQIELKQNTTHYCPNEIC